MRSLRGRCYGGGGTAHGSSNTAARRTFREGAEHVARRFLRQARELRGALEEAHHKPHAARLQRHLEVRVRQRLRAAFVDAAVVRPGAGGVAASAMMQFT